MRVIPDLIPDHQYGVPKDCSWSDQNQEMAQEACVPIPANL